MKIILKYILRNITAKPLRTAIIILCLGAVSLTFSLCISINIASQKAIDELIRGGTGKTDIMLSDAMGFDEIPELPEEVDYMPTVQASSYLQLHSIDNYKYVQKKDITVLGVSTDKAISFNLIPECTQPQSGEIIISSAISQMFGYCVGDVLTLPCANGVELSLTVKQVVPNHNYLSLVPLTVITAPDTAKVISGYTDIAANVIHIDVKDDSRISEISAELMSNYPDITVQQVMGTDEINDMVSGLTYTFFTLFAVTFLMIVFIISAFAKNIAAERLPTIGTLKSIGAKKNTAAATLLMECSFYGIAGGLVGGVLFYLLKDLLIGGVVPSAEGFESGDVYVPFYIPLASLALAVAISCIFSLGAIMRTSKTSIREIILGGKESVFKPEASQSIIGAILLCISGVLYFLNYNSALNISALVAFITGICVLIPKVMSVLSSFTANHTSGSAFPLLRLALINLGTRKSTVSGTVISTAIVLLTSSLFILSHSTDMLYSARNFNCDCIITDLSERAEGYKLITADDSEFIYNTEEVAEINGTKININVFGYDGFKLFSGISGLPEKIEENEIALDNAIMKKLSLSEGDKISIVLKQNSVRPIKLELTVISGCESIYYDMRCNAAVINLETYIGIYHDYPSVLLAKTSDTDLVRRQIIDSSARFMTSEDYYYQTEDESKSVTSLLYMLTALGILLAVISASGNQFIGYEQRKHELAVQRAQGISIGQLSRMLILEAAVTATISADCFAVFGSIVMEMIRAILSTLDINIPIVASPLGVLALVGVLSVEIVLTALIPIRALKKMNIAAELKQE